MENILSLKKIQLHVHIGEIDQEREKPQKILVSVDVKFLKTPISVLEDHLKNGVCYSKILEIIRFTSKASRFSLIEHWAYFFYQEIKNQLTSKEDYLLRVLVHKVHPPSLLNIKGGASYIYGDEF